HGIWRWEVGPALVHWSSREARAGPRRMARLGAEPDRSDLMLCLFRRAAVAFTLLVMVLLCPGAQRHPDWGFYPPGWPGFAYNAQHWSAPKIPSQPLLRVKWSAPVDLVPRAWVTTGPRW